MLNVVLMLDAFVEERPVEEGFLGNRGLPCSPPPVPKAGVHISAVTPSRAGTGLG